MPKTSVKRLAIVANGANSSVAVAAIMAAEGDILDAVKGGTDVKGVILDASKSVGHGGRIDALDIPFEPDSKDDKNENVPFHALRMTGAKGCFD